MDYDARRTGESDSESVLDKVRATLTDVAVELILTIDADGDRKLRVEYGDDSAICEWARMRNGRKHLQAVVRGALEHLSSTNVDRAIRRANKLREAFGEDPLPEHFIGGHRSGDVKAWADTLEAADGPDLPHEFEGESGDASGVVIEVGNVRVTVESTGYSLNDTRVSVEATCLSDFATTVDYWGDSLTLATVGLWALSDEHAEDVLRDFDSVEAD